MPRFKGSCGCYNREDARQLGLAPAIVWNDMLDRAEHFDINPMWYDQKEAADRLGMSETSLKRAVDKLVEAGRITKRKGYRPGTTLSTTWITIFENVNDDTSRKSDLTLPRKSDLTLPILKETNNDTDIMASTVRMRPSALRQELVRIFKAKDPSKTRSTQAIAELQRKIDDDSLILKAARKMKDQAPVELNGRSWQPDYFWFVNPDKTDIVARRIIEAVKNDLVEEEIPEGLQERYDVAIQLGEATDYNDCRENWGKILPKIKFTDEYRRLTDGR